MGTHGTAYGRFRRSLDAQNVTGALSAAAELPRITLIDSLELCRLLASKGNDRYSRAAARWVRRLIEDGATLEDAQLAGAALSQLQSDPESAIAWQTLCELCDEGS